MKTLKQLTAVLCFLLLGGSSFAQPFEMAYHGTYGPPPWYPLYATDFQHYSIESTPAGEYVIAGTVLNSATGNTDIHLMKLDNAGNLLWEVNVDYAGFDDAALDVAVDPANEIVVCGYVSNSPNFPEMYVAKYDPAGGLIMDNIITGFPTAASAGTNIIYSMTTNNYVVGGFHHDPPVMYPLVDGQAVVVELDPGLNPMATSLFSRTGGIEDHSSINDIEEVPGVGYFVTGTYESNWGTPAVLAVMLDPGLNMMNDLSFNDGTATNQCGVSAFYDMPSDEIFLVSNHGSTADPQLRRIVGASGGGFIAQQIDINIFDQTMTPVDGSAFKIMECPWNPADFVIAGRFKFGTSGTGMDNNAWLLSFDKGGLFQTGGMTWNMTSPNYEAFAPTVMGPLFSTWVGSHPYIYNEEIITNRIDMAGLVLIAPTDIASPNYGINVVTTNALNPLGCYDGIRAILSPATTNFDPITFIPFGVGAIPQGLWGQRKTGMDWNCLDPSLPRSAEAYDGKEEITHNLASIEDESVHFDISPNPSSDIFNIAISGEELQGQFTVTNSIGKVVYVSPQFKTTGYKTQVDLSDFEHGVYIIQFTSGEKQITKKLIKL